MLYRVVAHYSSRSSSFTSHTKALTEYAAHKPNRGFMNREEISKYCGGLFTIDTVRSVEVNYKDFNNSEVGAATIIVIED